MGTDVVLRQSRKLEHIKYALLLPDGPVKNGFEDLSLVHNCLPNLALNNIDLTTSFAGIPLKHPVVINAITGGAEDVKGMNAILARFASITSSPMAIGSQYSALEDPTTQDSYKIIRKNNPDGIVFANLGAHASVAQAKKAVDMIKAQAIQVHLNVAQELYMEEGDRDFSGYLENISRIVDSVGVPVIVKEVGFGMAAEQVEQLMATGVQAIDIGGSGGTNFIAIESARCQSAVDTESLHWGITTAISAIESKQALSGDIDLMVSGGIRSSLDIMKALVIGAKTVGIAAPIIRQLSGAGLESTVDWFHSLMENLRRYMLLTGSLNITEASKQPLIIMGYTRDWLTARGIDITEFAIRKKHG